MIVVIQCAAKKKQDAGCLRKGDGKKILFIADPDKAPVKKDCVYARPDDLSDKGPPWRELLLKYNAGPGNNPLGLYPAYELYQNATYHRLVDRFGLEKVFILSAGWGLIGASFLTPNYDITFSASADAYKRRKKSDVYLDLCQLPEGTDEELYFFGGKDYLPLFCALTESYQGKRTIFFNSAQLPKAFGCSLTRFVTRTRTNWHYECANAFASGKLDATTEPQIFRGVLEKAHVIDKESRHQSHNTFEDKNLKPNIETTWARIKALQGQPFETKTGKPFTFEISGNIFWSSRTKYNITKHDFAKALDLVPIDGPGKISNLVRGSAYIWAVLHDQRVRKGKW